MKVGKSVAAWLSLKRAGRNLRSAQQMIAELPLGRTEPRGRTGRRLLLGLLGSCLALGTAWSQDTNEVEQLKKQLQSLQENFERIQRQQKEQIDALTKKLDALSRQQDTEAEKKKLESEMAAELATNTPPAAATGRAATPPPAWSPAQPLTLTRAGSAYLNLSFDVLLDLGWSTAPNPSQFLELGAHDPSQRGFSLPNAEIALDGGVDPYFKGFGNIAFSLDQNNETQVELEEAYLQTTSLPANLQVKAGQFNAPFGRQNLQHPHQWAFADSPVMLVRTLGPEGTRNLGAQLSWLAPTPFFTEASVAVLNGEGTTAFSFRDPGEPVNGVDSLHGRQTTIYPISGPGDLLYVSHVTSSFELTPQQTLVLGASTAFGPNSTGPQSSTDIYGADIYWKWKPANAHLGWPFVSLQTEGLYQRFGANADPAVSLPSENLRDWGIYSQVLWGFTPRWVAGLRGEYANGNPGAYDPNDVYRGERTRVSPVITFYPSEFSKLRLQYNYDQGEYFGTQHSIWFQVEFLLGAHGAHKF
jgi:hypothetical protein